jgi:hypothetical protein
MSERPDPDSLRELGHQTTNVANAWAGAADYLSRGLKQWTRYAITGDRGIAVRAAIAACELVADRYPETSDGLPPRQYVEHMMSAIRRWIADPSRENQEYVRSSLDVTREAHAWQREDDVASFWILEAVDHACLAVWSGEKKSYIVPLDYATCAARSVACVLHALRDADVPEKQAVDMIVDVIEEITGAEPPG